VTAEGPYGPASGAAEQGAGTPSEEELQAALEEQMRRLTVSDVLVQTVVTLVNLGARKLGLTGEPGGEGEEGADAPDLEQARLAIEATRALVPLLPADAGPIRDALSQLQMAYARAAGAGASGEAASGERPPTPGEPDGEPPQQAGAPGERPAAPAAADPERERARSKIWTPPGT
jgi:hypothetical protein